MMPGEEESTVCEKLQSLTTNDTASTSSASNGKPCALPDSVSLRTGCLDREAAVPLESNYEPKHSGAGNCSGYVIHTTPDGEEQLDFRSEDGGGTVKRESEDEVTERRRKCDAVRLRGLGDFHVFADIYIDFLVKRYLDPIDLLRLSETSPIWYLYANNENSWKRKCIGRHFGNFLFQGTWKRTYFSNRGVYEDVSTHYLEDDAKALPRIPPPPPVPSISVPDFYSVKMYKKWYRGHVDVKHFSAIPDGCPTIEKRSNLSLKEFQEEYAAKCRPVIITDVVTKWKAMDLWTPEKLTERFKDRLAKVDEVDEQGNKMKLNFKDYIEYAKINKDEDPIYMFEPRLHKRLPELIDDYEVPIYFREDLYSLLESRSYYRWFILGPARSGSPFHVDPEGTNAWNALLHGRKRWLLYPPAPPHWAPPGVKVTDGRSGVEYSAPTPIKYLIEAYPFIASNQKPFEVIQEPGEVIFVPAGWWHCVLNIEENVAVTQNFVDRNTIGSILFNIKADLARDDEPGTFEEFLESMKHKFPEAHNTVQRLLALQAQSPQDGR